MKKIAIIGGGAGGFFAAINCAEQFPDCQVTIYERSKDVLAKVKISGGGRCNVCHAEYDPRELVKAYPRGAKAMIGPFHKFCTGDTQGWYSERGVELKAEDDGRMFPVTDSSQTIVNCLRESAQSAKVNVVKQANLISLKLSDAYWILEFTNGKTLQADKVLLAPGSSPQIWKMLAELGHTIVPPVPSLFTFNIKDPRIAGLQGISVPNAEIRVKGNKLMASGPLLITHWGLSGPAILRISAWGARELHACEYKFELQINWLEKHQPESIKDALQELRDKNPAKQIYTYSQFGLPGRLWRSLCEAAGIPKDLRWADLRKEQQRALGTELCAGVYSVHGKSTFKDEFVTCGGVQLKEVDFKTMQSKVLPGLFFAGEVLNIDAITGGFNFQAAWTTAWLAAKGMGETE